MRSWETKEIIDDIIDLQIALLKSELKNEKKSADYYSELSNEEISDKKLMLLLKREHLSQCTILLDKIDILNKEKEHQSKLNSLLAPF